MKHNIYDETTHRHIILKLLKTKGKEKNRKTPREKKTLQWNKFKSIADFLLEMIRGRFWNSIPSVSEKLMSCTRISIFKNIPSK